MIRATVLTDGSSDRALFPIIEWALKQTDITTEIQLDWADFQGLRVRPIGLVHRITKALELYPCDVLFVHRDAEAQGADVRFSEIREAIREVNRHLPYVCVVPVRMLEAWLLCDVVAIRKASDNPNGSCEITLPPVHQRETMADPKARLVQLLKAASELSGRRLKGFDALRARTLVAQNISDFRPLRQLASFRAFESDLGTLVRQHHLDSYR
jgi:hypothetical protein